MSPQTSVSLYLTNGLPGLIADARDRVVESYAAEAAVRFGAAVVAGTDPAKEVILPSAGSQTFRGIAVSTWHVEQVPGTTVTSYAVTDTVNVMRRGMIWVTVNGTVAVDDAAFFVHTGGVGDIGNFRADTTNADAVPTGVFKSAATAGNLAKLEINLP